MMSATLVRLSQPSRHPEPELSGSCVAMWGGAYGVKGTILPDEMASAALADPPRPA